MKSSFLVAPFPPLSHTPFLTFAHLFWLCFNDFSVSSNCSLSHQEGNLSCDVKWLSCSFSSLALILHPPCSPLFHHSWSPLCTLPPPLNFFLSNLLWLQLFFFLSVFSATFCRPTYAQLSLLVLLFFALHFPIFTTKSPHSSPSIHSSSDLLSQLWSQLFPASAPAFPWRGPSSLPRAPSIPRSGGQKADAAQHLLLPHRQREVMSRLSCSAQPQSLCVLSVSPCTSGFNIVAWLGCVWVIIGQRSCSLWSIWVWSVGTSKRCIAVLDSLCRWVIVSLWKGAWPLCMKWCFYSRAFKVNLNQDNYRAALHCSTLHPPPISFSFISFSPSIPCDTALRLHPCTSSRLLCSTSSLVPRSLLLSYSNLLSAIVSLSALLFLFLHQDPSSEPVKRLFSER